jgi:Uma2 family endonuclease
MIDKTRLTAVQFFPLQAAADERLELIDGEIVVAATPIPDHQLVIMRLIKRLQQIEDTFGGLTIATPLEIHFDEANIFQPDLVWLAPNSRCKIGAKRFEGAPELIIEVLSPSSVRHDKATKFAVYERHGVNEYWIVDVANQSIDVWTLRDGQYARQGSYAPGDTFTSAVLGGADVDVTAIFTY